MTRGKVPGVRIPIPDFGRDLRRTSEQLTKIYNLAEPTAQIQRLVDQVLVTEYTVEPSVAPAKCGDVLHDTCRRYVVEAVR